MPYRKAVRARKKKHWVDDQRMSEQAQQHQHWALYALPEQDVMAVHLIW
jgi:hypothetical protein